MRLFAVELEAEWWVLNTGKCHVNAFDPWVMFSVNFDILKKDLSCSYSPLYSSKQYCFFRHYMKRDRCLGINKESFPSPSHSLVQKVFLNSNNKVYQYALISFSGNFGFDYQFSKRKHENKNYIPV